jgi:hypothetical protein
MKTLFRVLVCLIALGLALPAFAGTIKEYTADMVDVASGKVVGSVAATENKMRWESHEDDDKSLSIIRMDQGKMYAFQEDKTFIEIPIKEDTVLTPAGLAGAMLGDAFKITREKVGTETVSGYHTEKFKVTYTANIMGHSKPTIITEWTAEEFDIPVRMEADDGTVEMRNIKVGAPDASLFEIPAGYTKNTQFEEMMKMMQQQQQ